MTRVLTDQTLIDKFLTRSVEAVFPTLAAVRSRLLSGDRLKIYQGFDPTGRFLHVGHAIGIRALRLLQQLGHEVIFLVGDYTSLLGDPDKDSTRPMLTIEDVERNMAGWKEQAAQLIDFEGENPVCFRRNSEWLSQLRLDDLLQLLSHITVQRLQERDLFQRRLQKQEPILLREFIYPLMQGYDGVAMQVDLEIGGADQIFNMLVGRHLSKVYLNKEKCVRANKMMDAPDGKTMSKTRGNGINLGDDAENMYGKAMSYPDRCIAGGLELLTDQPLEEIAEMQRSIASGANPMQYKQLMAFEIVKSVKGAEAARRAEAHFAKTVQHKELPDEIEERSVESKEWSVVDLAAELGLSPSRSETRRLIQGGGVKIDGQRWDDVHALVAVNRPIVIQFGKRRFVRVRSSRSAPPRQT